MARTTWPWASMIAGFVMVSRVALSRKFRCTTAAATRSGQNITMPGWQSRKSAWRMDSFAHRSSSTNARSMSRLTPAISPGF